MSRFTTQFQMRCWFGSAAIFEAVFLGCLTTALLIVSLNRSFNWWPMFHFVDAVCQYLADDPEACVPCHILWFSNKCSCFWRIVLPLWDSCLLPFIFENFKCKWMMSDSISQKRQPAVCSWFYNRDLFILSLVSVSAVLRIWSMFRMLQLLLSFLWPAACLPCNCGAGFF